MTEVALTAATSDRGNMVKLRQIVTTFLFCSALFASCAFAQSTLTQILDTVYSADGTPFNGTVTITWVNFNQTGSSVAPLSTSAAIYNGALSVLLVPSTTAGTGAYYLASYNSSNGLTSWTETWVVPASTTPLTLSQVRQTPTNSGGSSPGGSGPCTNCATLPIAITEITGLSTDLSTINSSLTSLDNTLSGLSSTVVTDTASISTLTSNVGSLSSNVTTLDNTMAGFQTTLNTLTDGSTTAVLVDAEAPAGTVDGNNAVFTLAQPPAPSNSLELYVNGLLRTNGIDYSLAGSTITFNATSTPRAGDILQAYYRVPGTGTTATFTDGEVPGGSVNGTNAAFTLAAVPNPAGSLRLFKNGMLLAQTNDYSLSGSTVTFIPGVVPQPGDVLVASYRTAVQSSNIVVQH